MDRQQLHLLIFHVSKFKALFIYPYRYSSKMSFWSEVGNEIIIINFITQIVYSYKIRTHQLRYIIMQYVLVDNGH